MTKKEKQLLENYSKLNFDQLSDEVNNNDFDKDDFSEEFRNELCDLISSACFREYPQENIPFEESLQKAFDSWSKEEQQEFLNEDWSDILG